jgi:hypothetical protein
MSPPFYGKYRGIVTDIKDPLNMGRIRAKVNDVLGPAESGWAMPCVPFAGQNMGFYVLPPEGSGVWIEFEKGDPDFPIWTGGWWGAPFEIPTEALNPLYKTFVIKFEGGTTIIIDETPGKGGVTIKGVGGQEFKLLPTGIELKDATPGMGITIATALGQALKLAATGIEIDDGQGGSIKMQGPQVDINGGALTVT